jgi:hypothetical protein
MSKLIMSRTIEEHRLSRHNQYRHWFKKGKKKEKILYRLNLHTRHGSGLLTKPGYPIPNHDDQFQSTKPIHDTEAAKHQSDPDSIVSVGQRNAETSSSSSISEGVVSDSS